MTNGNIGPKAFSIDLRNLIIFYFIEWYENLIVQLDIAKKR